MASPVWILSVDLQTKTATFQTGMADAARSARSAFKDIGESSKEGGKHVENSMVSGRLALHSFTNVLTGDVENALVDVMDEMQRFSFFMKAIPFLAMAGGVGLLVTGAVEAVAKYKEWREESKKLSDEQTRFGTAVNESFNSLDTKILQAEQRSDELRNDHLGALHKELELINRSRMDALVQQFEAIAKASDETFKHLEVSWYNLGIGSAGATHALSDFKTQYESLVSQGKDKEAGDLLAGTLDTAKKVLQAQKDAQAANVHTGALGVSGDQSKLEDAKTRLELLHSGVGYTEKEVAAQQTLVKVLSDQLTAAERLAKLQALEGGNAKKGEGNRESAEASSAAQAHVASQLRIGELAIQADRATAASRLEISRATIAERLQNDLDFAARERDVQLAANQAEVAALDKASKDYANQKKALADKALEIEAAYTTRDAELRAKAATDTAKKELTDLEQSEREKIAATRDGSAERLAVLASAIQKAEALHLQDTDYYRSLLTQRTEATRRAADTEAKLTAEAAREEAESSLRVKELVLAAEGERQAVINSSRRMTDEQIVAQDIAFANREFAIKQEAIRKEQAALDTSAVDYQNKLKALQDKERQMVLQHENEVTAIKDRATMQRNSRVLSAESQFANTIANGLTSSIMGHQSWASMMLSIGDQVVSGMLTNAMKVAVGLEVERRHEAASAARKGYLAGMHFPFPTNIVMAPVLGAASFAAVMAFNSGTDGVPGVGNRDTVPALLTPGEGVVPGGVMDGLRKVANSGGFDQRPATHVHVAPTYHLHALDSGGMEKVLTKHAGAIEKHVNDAFRRLNRN